MVLKAVTIKQLEEYTDKLDDKITEIHELLHLHENLIKQLAINNKNPDVIKHLNSIRFKIINKYHS